MTNGRKNEDKLCFQKHWQLPDEWINKCDPTTAEFTGCYASRWNAEGQMEEKPERGIICSSWIRGRTAEGAHLLFGLFLVAADLQVILQHSAQRHRDTCYCGRDLLSACISSIMASCDLRFPFKSLFFGQRINYTEKKSSELVVHVGEWGSGHSQLKTYQMFSF